MADQASVLVRRTKKLVTTGFGALAVTAALLSLGTGTSYADDLEADPAAPSSGPEVEDGVRPSGYQDRSATMGETKESDIAVPGFKPETTGGSPSPGDISAGIPFCIMDFAGC